VNLLQLARVSLVGLIFFGAGYDRLPESWAQQTREQAAVQQFAEIAKVKVDQAGTIYLNGRIVKIEQLRQEFARLKQANGAVWYYRQNPEGEPPPQAMAVIQAIIDASLPVRLLERDFD
jgi:biopolymer transport protein ExbD